MKINKIIFILINLLILKLNCAEIEKLRIAIVSRDEGQVRSLINSGTVDINSFDIDGYTPLIKAVNLRLKNIVKLLLDADADANLKDLNHGRTPLIWAAGTKPEIVGQLLKAKADINATDNYGNTALIFQADLIPRSISGRKVLVEKDDSDIIKFLLHNKADYKEIKNKQDKTFLDIAAENPEVAKIFAEYEKEVAITKATCKEVFDAIPSFPKAIANMVAEYVQSCPRD